MERQERCATCRFWLNLHDPGDQGDQGRCQRLPPAGPSVFALAMLAKGRRPVDASDEFGQPVTLHHDWCGEYQPRSPATRPETAPA